MGVLNLKKKLKSYFLYILKPPINFQNNSKTFERFLQKT
jgi:hypothetical protein